jgi:hypothetical protein
MGARNLRSPETKQITNYYSKLTPVQGYNNNSSQSHVYSSMRKAVILVRRSKKMFYSQLKKSLLSGAIFLYTLVNCSASLAGTADIFLPYVDSIANELPTGLTFRLPSYFEVMQHSDLNPEQLIIRRFPSDYPLKYNLSVFTCQEGIFTCLLASFSVERADSPEAFNELLRYSRQGDPITLNSDYQGYLIRGYFMDGTKQNPSQPFSSIMWQQDYMIYTVSLPALERQSLLYIAFSMAQEAPILH